MKSRNILIEKYIEPSEIMPETDINFGFDSWLDRNGDRHSFMGQPAEISYENGKIKNQFWYKKGERHRDGDLPARIGYDCNGQISYQEWYKKGVLHRDGDLPAEIFYDSNRQITYKGWYKKGKLHRDGDLPAEIWYYPSGEIKRQHWYKNGKFIKEENY